MLYILQHLQHLIFDADICGIILYIYVVMFDDDT